ncbi:hypothetical protein [Burkholderia gladioli]|uniref:hypothetical protein n=1 Tax=Burkholderia gladioli TaxID=28095 RepID=UPI00163EE96A|nr:hypothetical protein [Burkholderia gladioli]
MIGKFVSECMGLAHAAHDILSGPNWAPFLTKTGALSKTKTGAPRVKETALSADLALEAQALLKKGSQRQRALSPLGFVPSDAISFVQADALMPGKKTTGNNSKRPDLVFMPADPELNLVFAVEAKVLEGQSDSKDLLLGPEGIGCFTRSNDPYETSGVIGLFGYADHSSVAQHQAALHSAMTSDSVTGFVSVATAQRNCVWDSVTTARESTLATTKSSGLLCLGVVLGFPSIRQTGAAPAKKRATIAKAGTRVPARTTTLTSSATHTGDQTKNAVKR